MIVRRVQSPEDIHRAYPCSTEIPIPFWVNGLPMCREWMTENLGAHIEGLHLEDNKGNVIGHIYYAPSEKALAAYELEDGIAYIYCEWVQEQFRAHGGAHLLFKELVRTLKKQDCKGILVDGGDYEGYMYYRHFLKRGFHIADESGGSKLLFYPLKQASVKVNPIITNIPTRGTGKVEVLVIGAHFCPVGASAVLAARKVAHEYANQVILREIASSREAIEKYGVSDGFFINGKAKFSGPVRESQVRQAIEEEIRELSSKNQ